MSRLKMPAISPNSTTSVPQLTSLRFLAATWVFVFHLCLHVGEFPENPFAKSFLYAGPVGMSFFFVLSGFILAFAYYDKMPWQRYAHYLTRRFARIYPIYLFVLVSGWTLIGFARDMDGKSHSQLAFIGIADLTLTNSWFPNLFHEGYMRDGTWSLSAELFFYLLFPFILFHALGSKSRTLCIGIALCVAATVFFCVGAHLLAQKTMDYYSSPIYRLPEFIAGVFAGIVSRRSDVPKINGRGIAVFTIVLICYLGLTGRRLPWVFQSWIAVPYFIFLFDYMARSSDSLLSRLMSVRPAVFLGEASYALYMVQLVTIPVIVNVWGPHLDFSSVALCFIATNAIAALLHIWIEVPTRRMIISFGDGLITKNPK